MYVQMAEVENRHWWFVARRCLFREVLALCRLDPAATIVDLGCGTGGNFGLLKNYGQVLGLELDPAAAQIASARGPVVQGGAEQRWPLAPASIDAVTAFDVLEHIDDDQAALANIFASLRPGGRLILSVPAYQWLWSEHDELLHHRRRYVAGQVDSLARGAGFTVDYISYHNCLLFPVSLLSRMLSRLSFGRLRVDENRIPWAPVNALLRITYGLERHLLKRRIRLPFGLSIIAILSRPGQDRMQKGV